VKINYFRLQEIQNRPPVGLFIATSFKHDDDDADPVTRTERDAPFKIGKQKQGKKGYTVKEMGIRFQADLFL
jgi:hypothetical protein